MNRNANGHSAEYLKRQAKKIKRDLGIPYNEALDKAAITAGFTGWEHFINESALTVSATPKVNVAKQDLPTPLVITYNLVLSNTRLQRPNARMSIAIHQQIGGMLKILKKAAMHNKRALRPITDVAFQLDEWVQKEYKSREELSDDVFFDLYYGDVDVAVENQPSVERRTELQSLCQKIRVLLKNGYHECKPVSELLGKMDQAIKWISVWPAAKPERTSRRDVAVPAGAFVYVKSKKKSAVLISHDTASGTVTCYTDRGPQITSRQGITVPKDQSRAKGYRPMRLWLPYGKSICPDGKQVLFNRDYIPLWAKLPDGTVVTVSPDTWIEESHKEFFFKDGNAPWHPNKETRTRCVEALREWGVEDQVPELLALLPVAISNGDISLLKPDREPA